MYYITDTNNKIVLYDKDITKLQNTLIFMPQYAQQKIIETNKNIVTFNGNFYFEDDENYLKEKEENEQKIIANTSLTRADVFEALILARNITKPQLRKLIEEDTNLSEIQRTLYLNRFDDALEFYRKHPAIDFIADKLNIESSNMDNFFKTKDYTYLKETLTQ